jgi:hypothetical protein
MSEASNGCSVSCFGCLTFLLFIFFIWAIFFGVTINGTHYGISCDRHRGINIETRMEANEPKETRLER